jgi:hypothetical protein
MPSIIEERCWVPQRRPLREMDAAIRKVEDDPRVECGGLASDAELREGADPEDILYNELNPERGRGYHITEGQYRNIEYLVTGRGRPTDSAYKSHRRGYVFTDKEKEVAEAIGKNCSTPKVCAFTIKGHTREEPDSTASYEFGEPEPPVHPYRLECWGSNKEGRYGDVIRRKYQSLRELKEDLGRLGGSGRCLFGAEVLRADEIPVEIELSDESVVYDEVRYISLNFQNATLM